MVIKPQSSPYKRGADDGFIFGALLSAIFLSAFFSLDHPGLGMATFALALSVPFVTFVFLKRAYVADNCKTPLSSLWMQGIIMFLCGSMISGVVAVICLKYLDPTWMTRTLETALEAYRQMDTPQADQAAEIIEAILDNHLVPPAIEIVFQTIWFGVLSGSVLSVLTALIVRTRRAAPTTDNHDKHNFPQQ